MSILIATCVAAAAAGAGAANSRTTSVMTVNIYQGTELEHALAAQTPFQLLLGVAAGYAT